MGWQRNEFRDGGVEDIIWFDKSCIIIGFVRAGRAGLSTGIVSVNAEIEDKEGLVGLFASSGILEKDFCVAFN